MDDATVLHACRLLHEALCDDLELRRLTVQVERDRASITIQSKRGRQESKVIVGEDSQTTMSVSSTSGGTSAAIVNDRERISAYVEKFFCIARLVELAPVLAGLFLASD
jgi:hypothetical protein